MHKMRMIFKIGVVALVLVLSIAAGNAKADECWNIDLGSVDTTTALGTWTFRDTTQSTSWEIDDPAVPAGTTAAALQDWIVIEMNADADFGVACTLEETGTTSIRICCTDPIDVEVDFAGGGFNTMEGGVTVNGITFGASTNVPALSPGGVVLFLLLASTGGYIISRRRRVRS